MSELGWCQFGTLISANMQALRVRTVSPTSLALCPCACSLRWAEQGAGGGAVLLVNHPRGAPAWAGGQAAGSTERCLGSLGCAAGCPDEATLDLQGGSDEGLQCLALPCALCAGPGARRPPLPPRPAPLAGGARLGQAAAGAAAVPGGAASVRCAAAAGGPGLHLV